MVPQWVVELLYGVVGIATRIVVPTGLSFFDQVWTNLRFVLVVLGVPPTVFGRVEVRALLVVMIVLDSAFYGFEQLQVKGIVVFFLDWHRHLPVIIIVGQKKTVHWAILVMVHLIVWHVHGVAMVMEIVHRIVIIGFEYF